MSKEERYALMEAYLGFSPKEFLEDGACRARRSSRARRAAHGPVGVRCRERKRS
jgi:hypothetical protein